MNQPFMAGFLLGYQFGYFDAAGWDGKLVFEEIMAPYSLRNLALSSFTAIPSLQLYTPNANVIQETFTGYSLQGIRLAGFSDNVEFGEVIDQAIVSTDFLVGASYNVKYVDITDGFRLKTQYTFASMEQEIDEGKMCVVNIDTEQFARVDGIEVVMLNG